MDTISDVSHGFLSRQLWLQSVNAIVVSLTTGCQNVERQPTPLTLRTSCNRVSGCI